MLLCSTRAKARPRHDFGPSLPSSVLRYFASVIGFYSVSFFFLSERVLAFFVFIIADLGFSIHYLTDD